MGAENDVHIGIALLDLIRYLGLLGHTAADTDHQVGILLFVMRSLAHIAEDPHFRVLPDGAGIEDQEVGAALVVRQAEAHVDEHPPDQLAVGLVLLAAEGGDAGQGLPGQAIPVDLPHTLGILLLQVQLFPGQNDLFTAHNASKISIKIHYIL